MTSSVHVGLGGPDTLECDLLAFLPHPPLAHSPIHTVEVIVFTLVPLDHLGRERNTFHQQKRIG